MMMKNIIQNKELNLTLQKELKEVKEIITEGFEYMRSQANAEKYLQVNFSLY